MTHNENFETALNVVSLSLTLVPEDRFSLERLRIGMRVSTKEEVVARAFMEFARECGAEFGAETVDMALLQRLGLASSPSIVALRVVKSTLTVWVPSPKHPNALHVVKRRSRSENFSEVLRKALRRAHQKYVR